ncbi:MAG: hypothetical protein M0011_07720 [Elusimicrobia bacterium]|nr:hypothetical protein [Elusimicrobiota bacterium]
MGDGSGLKDKIWLSAGVLAAVGAVAMPVLNPDLYWHLSAGKYLTANLGLPSSDFLSWTEYGTGWTDFEWLAQLLYYAGYSLAGISGLFVLKMLLLSAVFPAFYLFLADAGLSWLAFFALPLWGLVVMPNSDLRPENFSVLFFAMLLLRLERARVSGRPWPSSPAGFIGLALFFALWANLHAGFAYGLLLLASYSAGAWADSRLWPSGPSAGGTAAGAGAAAAFIGSTLNPWGFGLYGILYRHAADSAALSRYLSEWAPPSLSNPWHWPFMALLAASLLLLLRRFLKERSLPLAQLLCLGWLALEASRHTRQIVFFGLAAVVFSLDSAVKLWEPGLLARRGKVLLVLCLAYLALLVWPRYLSFRSSIGAEASGAAAYLKSEASVLGGRRLYNPWTWGGYLGWALAPEYRVFTDGRYLFHKYLVPVSEAMRDQDAWDRFAAEKGFDIVIFRRDYSMLPYMQRAGKASVTVRRPSYLIFMPENKWALLYWDAFSVVFGRRGRPLPPEFRFLRPDDEESLKLALCSGTLKADAVSGELARYYAAAAGAHSTREADLFRLWLAGYPGACATLNRGQ